VSTPLRWPIEGRGCCSIPPRLVFHAGSVAPNPRPRPMPQRDPPSTRIVVTFWFQKLLSRIAERDPVRYNMTNVWGA
jgi:hypothetical protein